MAIDPEYIVEIKDWLQGLQPKWYIVDDVCDIEYREMFVQAIKAYIDEDWGDVYFDSNYKKLRKIEIPEFLTN